MILQKEITLDEAILDGFETYSNGCNFKLLSKQDGSRWLEYGCYCLVNLLTGKQRLLRDFLENVSTEEKLMRTLDKVNYPRRRIDHLVRPETIAELLKRKPCQCCGGFLWEPPSNKK